jgi:hypothetical protein
MRLFGSMSTGKNAITKIGDLIIHGGQTFDGNNPPKTSGQGLVEVKTWASFNFLKNNIPVLPFLKKALYRTEIIVDELSKI